jgi:AcrR family transcriptional regulator
MAEAPLEQRIPHPATMTPRQRDRRERLIDAAISLLQTEDYENVQVKEVADLAGVSLGTLYNYFYSKERLFAEALVKWASSLPANIRSRPLSDASPGERLKEAVHRALRAFERRPQMARLVNVLVMSTDPLAGELLVRMDRSTSDAYMQALSTIDPAVARTMVDVVNAVFTLALRDWSLGRITMRQVHDRLDSAIGLVVPA